MEKRTIAAVVGAEGASIATSYYALERFKESLGEELQRPTMHYEQMKTPVSQNYLENLRDATADVFSGSAASEQYLAVIGAAAALVIPAAVLGKVVWYNYLARNATATKQ